MFHVKLFSVLIFLFPFVAVAQHMGSTTLEVKELPSLPAKDVFIEKFVDSFDSGLTSNEKEWFYWTNYSRSNPKRFWDSIIAPLLKIYPSFRNSYTLSLKNDLYNSLGLPLVKPNDNLAKTAKLLAKSLAAKKATPSHTTAEGVTFQERMQSISIKRCAGENISFGPSNAVLMLVLLYVDEGVPDLGHRKTLLNPAFVEMGIGSGSYPDNKIIVVQDFGCDQK